MNREHRVYIVYIERKPLQNQHKTLPYAARAQGCPDTLNRMSIENQVQQVAWNPTDQRALLSDFRAVRPAQDTNFAGQNKMRALLLDSESSFFVFGSNLYLVHFVLCPFVFLNSCFSRRITYPKNVIL